LELPECSGRALGSLRWVPQWTPRQALRALLPTSIQTGLTVSQFSFASIIRTFAFAFAVPLCLVNAQDQTRHKADYFNFDRKAGSPEGLQKPGGTNVRSNLTVHHQSIRPGPETTTSAMEGNRLCGLLDGWTGRVASTQEMANYIEVQRIALASFEPG
jgi:hypothetical protein